METTMQELVEATYLNCNKFVQPSAKDCAFFVAEELSEVVRAAFASGDMKPDVEYLRAHPISHVEARGRVLGEYGDLVFMVLELGNLLGIDAEGALNVACLKIERRDRAADTS